MPLYSLARRFRAHAWATTTLARAIPPEAPRAARPLAHAVAADRLWRRRIAGDAPRTTDLWPAWTPGEIAEHARAEADAYGQLLADAGPLGRAVAYTTTAGAPFETPLGDVLEHVLLHGAHHRGQACAAIRSAGHAPPWVDFVAWVRLGEPTAP